MAGKSSADRLSSGERVVPISEHAFSTIKLAIKIVLGIAGLALLFYFIVVVPIGARYVHVYDYGTVTTVNPKTDTLKAGTQVVFQSDLNDPDAESKLDSLTGKWELATLPPTDIAVGVIEAGPTGEMSLSDKGVVSVDGKKTSLVKKGYVATEDRFLKNQYIVSCRGGGCAKGKTIVVTTNAIDGIVVNKELS